MSLESITLPKSLEFNYPAEYLNAYVIDASTVEIIVVE